MYRTLDHTHNSMAVISHNLKKMRNIGNTSETEEVDRIEVFRRCYDEEKRQGQVQLLLDASISYFSQEPAQDSRVIERSKEESNDGLTTITLTGSLPTCVSRRESLDYLTPMEFLNEYQKVLPMYPSSTEN